MIININKPAGITSHDVVSRIRKITGEKKVGHGGTLDPFATGVLVVAIGRESTKKLGELLKNTDKEYEATLKLGETSTTGDPEGEVVKSSKESIVNSINSERIDKVLGKFRGEIKQAPPNYSAVKVGGTPAYKLARRGILPKLQKRKVMVKNLEVVKYHPPLLQIRVVVSSGTYIRKLAMDIGKALKVGAYLIKLKRTKVGKYSLNNSKTIEEIEKDYE